MLRHGVNIQPSGYFQSSDNCAQLFSHKCCSFFCRACREVFLIPKAMPLAIKIYSPSPHFLLHIVNNDTVEELDMLFNIYQPNKVADVHISVVLLRFHPHLQ